jgi:molybdopterin-guanine dinucleotide biosynthesis protein
VSLVYDREKYSLTVREKRTDEDVIGLASKGDLVLLEGFKESGYPKIEIVQKEIGGGPIPELAGRIAYVSDIELQTDLPVFLPNDIQGIGDFIVDRYERGDLVRTDISVGGSVKMHKGDCQKETEE